MVGDSCGNESIGDGLKSIFLDLMHIFLILCLLILVGSLLLLLGHEGGIFWVALLVHLNDFLEVVDFLFNSLDLVDLVLLLVVWINFLVLDLLLELLGLLNFLGLVLD